MRKFHAQNLHTNGIVNRFPRKFSRKQTSVTVFAKFAWKMNFVKKFQLNWWISAKFAFSQRQQLCQSRASILFLVEHLLSKASLSAHIVLWCPHRRIHRYVAELLFPIFPGNNNIFDTHGGFWGAGDTSWPCRSSVMLSQWRKHYPPLFSPFFVQLSWRLSPPSPPPPPPTSIENVPPPPPTCERKRPRRGLQ
jgi:hypothetical protein